MIEAPSSTPGTALPEIPYLDGDVAGRWGGRSGIAPAVRGGKMLALTDAAQGGGEVEQAFGDDVDLRCLSPTRRRMVATRDAGEPVVDWAINRALVEGRAPTKTAQRSCLMSAIVRAYSGAGFPYFFRTDRLLPKLRTLTH